jgi:hypothetical protein
MEEVTLKFPKKWTVYSSARSLNTVITSSLSSSLFTSASSEGIVTEAESHVLVWKKVSHRTTDDESRFGVIRILFILAETFICVISNYKAIACSVNWVFFERGHVMDFYHKQTNKIMLRMPSSGTLGRVALLRTDVLPKRWFLQEPHGLISLKTAFFIVTAMKTSNLT